MNILNRIGMVAMTGLLIGCPAATTTQPITPVGPQTPPAQPETPAAQAPAPAPTPPAPASPPRKVASVEGITEYQLDNGLRVLLFPDPSQATVTVNITYFVGSKHEGYGEAGMAHLLEHMVFKGTPTHDDVWKLLEDHGASFNGTTWVDRTNYYETLPATKQNLDFALKLEADRMINSKIDPKDLATEFSVVRNEFEAGENVPRFILEERMHSVAYLWHNYGKSTIGNKSDIERVPVDNLRKFYQRHYQPDNAMLVVAGRFDEAEALAMVQQYFAPIPRPSRELPKTYTVEPVQDGERTVVLRRVGKVGVVGLLYHGLPGSHEDFAAAEALIHLMTDEPSGRLYNALVKPGLATQVYGHTYSWAEPGAIQFFAEVAPGKSLEKVRDKMLAVVEGVAETGKSRVSDAEVTRFKRRQAKNLRLAMASSQRVAVELSEWAALGDWRMLFVHRDRTDAVDKARVERVARDYLKRSNRTVGLYYPVEKPDRAPVTKVPDVVALTKDYKGKTKMSQGEEFVATVPNIESRLRRTTLANGMKVALLAKQTRGDAVKIRIAMNYGSERALRGKTTAANLIPRMLVRGSKKHSYQQIRDKLDELEAQVRFGGGGFFGGAAGSANVTITTTRDNVPGVIALVAELAQQPAFPADQFEIVRKERLASLDENKTDPIQQAFNRLIRNMAPYKKNDVRYLPTLEEQIRQLKRVRVTELRALHRDLWGAQNAEITVVGDFDQAATKAALETQFGAWRSKKPYKRIASAYKPHKAGEDIINLPDKKNAFIAAGHALKIRDDHPDYPALEMIGYILGGGASSRLLNRLRQKEGMSYGAFGGISADDEDAFGFLFTGALVNPQNAEKAMAIMLEEIQLLVAKGVSEKELEDAKTSYIKQFQNSLARDDFLASQITSDMHVGRTLTHHTKLHERIKQLTVADVQRVLGQYIKPAQLFRVRAGDFSK